MHLRKLNLLLERVLPLVDLTNAQPGSLSSLLLRRHQLIFKEVKAAFFHLMTTKSASNDAVVMMPSITIDRITASECYDRKKKNPEAARNRDARGLASGTVIGQAFEQLRGVDPTRLRPPAPRSGGPHIAFNVTFAKEKVLGQAGPYRGFFADVCDELRACTGPNDTYPLPLFLPTPNAIHAVGEARDKFYPNPSATSPQHLELYEFVGRLIGIAIRTRVLLALDLPSLVWKQLGGKTPTRADLRQVDHSLVAGVLEPLSACRDEQEFKAKFMDGPNSTLFFPVTRSDNTLVLPEEEGEGEGERKDGESAGSATLVGVTWERRSDYLRLLEEARLSEAALQIDAMRRGMEDIIPLPALSLLTWYELEELVCGQRDIDLELLKRHTEYGGGFDRNSPQVQWLWRTLEGFSNEQRRKFIKFGLAQERLPPNDEGFTSSRTRMMIKGSTASGDHDTQLPHADTCFFNVTLPLYSTEEILRERLTTVVAMDWGMSGDDAPMDAGTLFDPPPIPVPSPPSSSSSRRTTGLAPPSSSSSRAAAAAAASGNGSSSSSSNSNSSSSSSSSSNSSSSRQSSAESLGSMLGAFAQLGAFLGSLAGPDGAGAGDVDGNGNDDEDGEDEDQDDVSGGDNWFDG